MLHFRLIVIKYADRGLAQIGGIASNLFINLYILLTASMTILLCLSLFVRIWRTGCDDSSDKQACLLAECHICHIPGRTDHDQYITPEIGHYFLANVFTFMIFTNVHYLTKKHGDLRKIKVQRNIITFHSNFYFFMFFMFISLPVYILKSLPQSSTSRLIIQILISFHIIKLFVVCFLRPLVIIYLLKRNRPNFFTDKPEENQNESFFITGQSFHPRPEIFCSLKPFCQNARWGWGMKRPNIAEKISKCKNKLTLNVKWDGSNVSQSSNSMPDIDI